MLRPASFALTLLAIAGLAARAETNPPRKVPPFTLKDPADKTWSFKDFQGGKAVVVVFVGTECPVNNAFMAHLVELHKAYAPRGVAFVAINANCQDTPARIAAHAREHGLPFPVLRDVANVVADRFGARRTPEAFVLDPAGTVLYRGRIDDQFGVGFKRPAPTRRDLAEALDEVLDGKPVSRPTTPVAGCLIARARTPRETGSITYHKQVAPLVQKHCQECHRPGQVGPMPLLTYEDVLAWSEMIQEVVAERRMPPWHADPAHGKFSNDRSLPAAARDTLLGWIDQECPAGDPADAPPARGFPKGWTIGEPDVVFRMESETKVPAKGGPRGVPYRYFTVPTNFDEDKWVVAAEARPGNRAVVHHIIVYVSEASIRDERRHPDGIGHGLLVAYAPGDLPAVFPAGAAKKIPRGSVLLFQMHYTPNGVEQTDRSSVGLIFAKGPPEREVVTRAVAQGRFEIPAGAASHEVKSATTFERDVELLGLMPHMHLRGKDFIYRVVYPGGKTETLLSVPRYDFNWQSNYRLARPLRLPAGTRVECTAHFDNSAANPNNPDPGAAVRWGDQTWQEMMIGFVDYAWLAKPAAEPPKGTAR
jgi:peroxiredoxin